MMLKCHFSPTVKVKPRYGGDVLSRGRAWFAFSFLLNEVGDLSFFGISLFSYSSSLCCKKIVKNLRQKKKLHEKKYS